MNSQPTCPPDVLDLLPWYPDDGLSGDERGIVEAHAATCPECRREILDGLRGAHLPESAPSPERVLARVFARIAEGGEPVSAPTPLPVRPAPLVAPGVVRHAAPPRHAGRSRLGSLPAWAAAAGIALAVGSLATLAAVRLTATPSPVYETASAPPLPRAPGAQLEVILRDDVSAAQVRSALQSVGAEIVGGPTALGRYQLKLTAGTNAAAAASALRAEGTGIATFAEPLPD